ncbi:hypothetical protein Scep_020160 [Stephania cephalantha]|uniref:Uncharacterized protein n=1 Tax=Stephania cephalantha TaxID=152367 RepID=A0AAP0IC43_9MAGN
MTTTTASGEGRSGQVQRSQQQRPRGRRGPAATAVAERSASPFGDVAVTWRQACTDSAFSKGAICNSIMASYAHNYGRFEDSYYHAVNEVVRVCGNCGECFHPTYACPYSKYMNHHGSTYASPQPNFYMSKRNPQIPQHEKRYIRDMMNDLIFREPTFQQSHQHERRTIADIERNMISDWFSQSTTQQPLQEDMQHMKSKLQNSETQVTAILEHLMDEEELPPQPVFDSDETVNADTSKSVEFDEFSIVDEHLSVPEETLDVSSHEPDITIAQYDDDEAEKEIEVISERSDEPQKENEEDQPLVLVKPPTLPCIFVRPCKGVDVKERSWIFYTADTFVLDDHDSTDSFVLEVPNELRTLKEGMHAALPKYVDAPFVVDISKGEGIT